MWLVKAGTQMQVFAPFGKPGGSTQVKQGDVLYIDNAPWRGYISTEDKVYDSHEVWDIVAVENGRSDVPGWAQRNIRNLGVVVLCRDGKYAMVKQNLAQYLD